MPKKLTCLFALLFCLSGCVAPYSQLNVSSDYGARLEYTEKIITTPDYLQTDKSYGGFGGKGSIFCGPVAISNSLMWLADNGYPRLAPNTGDRKKDQHDMIVALGDEIGVIGRGSTIQRMLPAMESYITDKGYKIKRLQFQGWRPHDAQYATGEFKPQLGWIRKSLEGKGAVILNLGWYLQEAGDKDFWRFWGHFVTLVGYGQENGKPYFIIHDPYSKSEPIHEKVFLERISEGTLLGNYKNLPQDAVGYYKIHGVRSKPRKAKAAILGGVIALEMAP